MQVLGVEGHGGQRPEGTQKQEGRDSGDVNEQAAGHREAGLGIATGLPMDSHVYRPNRPCIHHFPPPFAECLPKALIDHARCTRCRDFTPQASALMPHYSPIKKIKRKQCNRGEKDPSKSRIALCFHDLTQFNI
jgi:hypothetical protein